MAWPQEALRAHTALMRPFAEKLKDAGEFVAAEGLDAPVRARVVRAGKKGAPVIDGVFA